MMKFLNFIGLFFSKKNEKKRDNSKQKNSILKFLQWGNYSEVNHNSTKQFKNK
ncbi:MAG: hypothetical protein U9Q30_07110 [Campylobacterota bacterium]|nr:hypothetical protein [Campylobacterota bacterium]